MPDHPLPFPLPALTCHCLLSEHTSPTFRFCQSACISHNVASLSCALSVHLAGIASFSLSHLSRLSRYAASSISHGSAAHANLCNNIDTSLFATIRIQLSVSAVQHVESGRFALVSVHCRFYLDAKDTSVKTGHAVDQEHQDGHGWQLQYRLAEFSGDIEQSRQSYSRYAFKGTLRCPEAVSRVAGDA